MGASPAYSTVNCAQLELPAPPAASGMEVLGCAQAGWINGNMGFGFVCGDGFLFAWEFLQVQ